MPTNQRLELLSVIKQTPEEHIPELLGFVHSFYKYRTMHPLMFGMWQ